MRGFIAFAAAFVCGRSNTRLGGMLGHLEVMATLALIKVALLRSAFCGGSIMKTSKLVFATLALIKVALLRSAF